ncbi:hypothetical protein [Roseibacillus persicicus]|uniref:hypothetical protein n=1 Tax=Roseibacillus persicicus TaxID=454148 RepID=UPI00280F0295|nr:hypothetical protein [Roseibacillus persicicus]MDQ8190585.1 hypothetical protein [Roseibacillus persicicus]
MFPVLAAGVGLGFPAHAQNFLPAPGVAAPEESAEETSEIPVPQSGSTEDSAESTDPNSFEEEFLEEEALEEIPLEEPETTPVEPVPFADQATSQENTSASIAQSGELLPGGSNGDFSREGWIFGLTANVGYDSNLLQDEDDEESDFVANFAPTVTYNSAPPGGAETMFELSYSPIARLYLENSGYNALDHVGGASLKYNGPVANFSSSFLLSQITRPDTYLEGLSQSLKMAFEASGSYQVSERTSLRMSLSRGYSEQDTASLSEIDTSLFTVSGLWQFSPLLKVGPSYRYSKSDSSNIGVSEASAAVIQVDYDASGLLNLSAFAGVEFVDFEGKGESGPTLGIAASYTAPHLPLSLSGLLNYQSVQQIASGANRGSGTGEAIWTGAVALNYELFEDTDLKVAALYGALPDPGVANVEITEMAITLGLEQNFGSWLLSGGVSLGNSSYDSLSATPTTRDDLRTTSFYLKHRTTLISDQLIWDTSARYSTSSGDREWNRIQLSSGLSIEF